MRVAVEKIDGVRSVTVSLKDGLAEIRLAPVNDVTLARIREAVRRNGFTAREAEVRIAGSLVRRGDTLTLVVPGTEDVFVLQDAPGSAGIVAQLRRRDPSQPVVLAGQVPAPRSRRSGGPERLLIRSIVAG